MISYIELIKSSFKVPLKAKWLLVYGLVIAMTGGGSWGNISQLIPPAEEEPQNVSVLPSSTNILDTWIESKSPTTWVALVGSIGAFAIFTTAVTWTASSWAAGSLIRGTKDSLEGRAVNLTNTSSTGLSFFKTLIKLQIITFLTVMLTILLGIALVAGISAGFAAIHIPSLISTIFIIAVAIVVIAVWLGILLLYIMTSIYAPRFVVFENLHAWASWKKGFKFSRSHFKHTIIMGVISAIFGSLVNFAAALALIVILGIPAYLAASPILSSEFRLFPLPNVIILIILLVIGISGFTLINAFLTVFKYSIWNQMFEKLGGRK